MAPAVIWSAYCGVLLGDVLGPGERLLQLGLHAVGDLLGVGRGGDRRPDRGRVPGGEQGTQDRLHDGAAEVA